MVHKIPDSHGRLELERDSNRLGFLCVNASISNTVTVDPEGRPRITMPPLSKLKVPDSISVIFQGTNSQRNFIVLEYSAGEEV